MSVDLKGQVAVVTGASRGVGRGIALGLGEAGATVYVTGRTVDGMPGVDDMPGTIEQTAAQVSALGGQGIPVRCDHRVDEHVEALFGRVEAEQGRLDVLVNNVWGGYEAILAEAGEYIWERPFWQQPLRTWDLMFAAGVRAHFTASRLAAPLMIPQRRGLIVNISFWAGQKYIANVIYGVAKTATDRMAKDLAHDLQPYNIAAVSIYPGLVRTERVMSVPDVFDFSNSESPQFTGRAVAALIADPELMSRTGQVLVAAQLALDYGFTDIDGRQPRPLTLETA